MNTRDDTNRRTLSTEQLLVWAYRDQRVHQARRLQIEGPTSRGPLAAYSKLWQDSAPIEASKNQGFEAAPDAWAIHELVLGLGRYQVDCGHDLAAARYHRLGQYRGAEPPIDAGSVDRSARSWPTDGQLHVDLRALVMIHASRATRTALPGREPVRFKPGDTVWLAKRRSWVYSKGLFCHIAAEGDLPGDLIEAWEVYMAWRRCLERLRDQLAATRLILFNVGAALPVALEKPEWGLTGE